MKTTSNESSHPRLSNQIPTARIPMDSPSVPTVLPIPAGACDGHLHMFASAHEFPRDPAREEDPAPGNLDLWISRLQRQMKLLSLSRAILVQSVVYGDNNAPLVAALERLGTTNFRGVGQVMPDVTREQLRRLHVAGIRGVRVNLRHTGTLSLEDLRTLAPRLADAGMHAQVLGGTSAQIESIVDQLAELPIEVVLDHHASMVPVHGVADLGPHFRKLFEAGRFHVKLSAAYRVVPPPYTSIAGLLRSLISLRPDRLIWGSDWPYVMFNGPSPDAGLLLDCVAAACTDEETFKTILVRTPERLYGFDDLGS